MKQCWRWFGPKDLIDLKDLHQVGVEGIVTALHEFPPGIVWPVESIRQRIETLQAFGYEWAVVESLPVSEAIKTQSADARAHLDAYKTSLRNLAQCGVRTICYNFMPILDWTRTELRAEQPHGGKAMQFRLVDFAVFDICILKRPDARDAYPDATVEAAMNRFTELDAESRRRLQSNIVSGLPGANDNWTLDDVATRLRAYDKIDAQQLRRNMIDFLAEVSPVAEALDMRLCCHPDDPPFELLGLPRIMSSLADYREILDAVDVNANGATLCTGSLGVSRAFDPVAFVQAIGDRIHFAHLRNTKRLLGSDAHRPDFYEAAHLEGDTDMVATVAALVAEENKRKAAGRHDWEIPMRPDHGQELLSDLETDSMPGYPLIGRMRGLAELRGVMAAAQSAQDTSTL